MQIDFVHPFTKQRLVPNSHGDLCLGAENGEVCFKLVEGCYDFSSATPEVREARGVYDEFYGEGDLELLTLDCLREPWEDKTLPWRTTMVQTLGNLAGRRVLLLGNGASYKELNFLAQGAEVVFTDLSLTAVQRAKRIVERSGVLANRLGSVQFHAVDAMHLPFADGSFDVIYGSKFVGFLSSMPDFFREVHRCLAPGGICRFTDDAHSPLWEGFRRAVVRPVKRVTVSQDKPSLAKVRSASHFGFDQQSVTQLCRECGFKSYFFVREYFFLRVFQLFYGKLVRWNPRRLRYGTPIFLVLRKFDEALAKTAWMQANALGLTWGFDK